MIPQDIELPEDLRKVLNIKEFRPAQEKAIKAGLLKQKNLLICTPTASGKTLIGELAIIKNIMEKKGRGVFVVPLKALATEKYKYFKKKYAGLIRVGLAIGDPDSPEYHLNDVDLIICTSEKLDSLLRHKVPWISVLKTLVIDEIHLLNDVSRGPTLEVVITLLSSLTNLQIIGLSATIGNPEELAGWLKATLILDNWRPVKLEKFIYDGSNKIKYD